MKELFTDLALVFSVSGLFLIVGAALIVAGYLVTEYLTRRWRREHEKGDESDD